MYGLLCGDFLYFGFYNTQIMKDAWYGKIKKEEFTLSKEILIYFRLPINLLVHNNDYF